MREDLANLEASIGYRFHQQDTLRRALTHSSRVHENPSEISGAPVDNERMEFLGDAVLGFLVSAALVRRFPSYPEGRLSALKGRLVSAAHLYELALELELGKYLYLGRGEEMSGGRVKRRLLVDCLEALIAAIYLDGGMEAATEFVNRWVMRDGQLNEQSVLGVQMVDYKRALQELTQARKMPLPRYLIVGESGPDHQKRFTIEVRVSHECAARAEGLTKKSAAQAAAREALEKLKATTAGNAP
jgi:ribonuclease-3